MQRAAISVPLLEGDARRITSMSDNNHILSCLKIGNNLDDAFRYVARHIREVLAGADGLEKGKKLIAQALAVQLIEITLVVLRILVSHLEVIGFPQANLLT